MSDVYDIVVIGSGTGGYSCALRAAQMGKRVAIVERDERLGGTCLLRGCIPTKALLQSAAVMDTVNRSEEWGIKASGEPDWTQVQAFETKIVDKLVSGLTSLVKARKIDVIQGSAVLQGGPGVRVADRTITATDVVLATGSRPKLLPGLQVTPRVITSDEALWYAEIPSSAVIIGAGAIGLEFASFYRSMGADVTMVEALPRVAPLEDEDLSKEIARAFRKRGIAAHAGASVTGVSDTGDHVEVAFEAGGAEQTVTADVCLVAVGRGPVTDDLGLEEAGVELDRGFVKVDGPAADDRHPRLGDRRRRGNPAAARPRLVHRGLRRRGAHRRRRGSRDRLHADPARDLLHARDRVRRHHRRRRRSSVATTSRSSGSTSKGSARRTSWARAGS
jgi:dihydrolipoamide dehydrogenase